jgi:antitoxin CptB
MSESIGLKRMYWHSRRGMLELDLILVPFAEKVLPGLSTEQQQDYERLLEEEDQDLFLLLTRRAPVPVRELEGIVATILAQV